MRDLQSPMDIERSMARVPRGEVGGRSEGRKPVIDTAEL